jgi:enolase
MTNNKQQTEINAVEYLGKVNQFAKENNTDKPRQQTVVEWIKYQVKQQGITHYFSLREILEYAEEIEKQQHIKSWEAGLMKVDFNEYYEQTYGGGEQ